MMLGYVQFILTTAIVFRRRFFFVTTTPLAFYKQTDTFQLSAAIVFKSGQTNLGTKIEQDGKNKKIRM